MIEQKNSQPDPDDYWLTPADVCARLKISRRTLDYMVSRNDFPAGKKIGVLRRWHIDTVRGWEARLKS